MPVFPAMRLMHPKCDGSLNADGEGSIDMTIYAVGDIHGQLGMLEDAIAKIEGDGGSDAQVVFLGDLVDRGPDSRGVIELLRSGIAAGRNWTVLRGNHDRMMSFYLEDAPRIDPQLLVNMGWLSARIGGVETLASYGIEVTEQSRHYLVKAEIKGAIPQAHIDFMAILPAFAEVGDLLFVHAGIRPEVALAEQTEDDMCWIRSEFLDFAAPHPWLVVHGHTHLPAPRHYGNRVNLDSGAGYGRPITAAAFEGRDCFVLGDTGRIALTPAS